MIGLAAAIGGALVAWHYHTLGLTLSHYDARGHLIVARRIADSITPGWQQIGAVWLPLPHLLNAMPVQIDLFYRTGASAVAISIASYAIATGAIAWIVSWLTGSEIAAAAGAAVFALNPNVLYLQSTPMTEPLLLATTTVAVAMLLSWSMADLTSWRRADLKVCTTPDGGRAGLNVCTTPDGGRAGLNVCTTPDGGRAGLNVCTTGDSDSRSAGLQACHVGWAFALACLTRYEAWPVTASALAAAAWTRWRRGQPLASALRAVAAVAIYPAIAIGGFTIFSRVVVGAWFVGADFFVPENKALGDPMMAASEIGWGARMLGGALLTWIGGAGVALAVGLGLLSRRRADALTAVALLGMAAIPWTAFLRGHPFRIRYMVPLIAIEAIGAGIAVGMVPARRLRAACAIALFALVGYELRPLDASAPMVVEAQWDRPNAPLRAQVTACVSRPLSGEKIMASMGSLGHYMQEASQSGLAIRDFLHEGNGDIWLAALERPRPFAAWMLIEEKAEGGDMLAHIARERPSFLQGYARVCEAAGLVLYQRAEGEGLRAPNQALSPKP
jgi:hypothetical protein